MNMVTNKILQQEDVISQFLQNSEDIQFSLFQDMKQKKEQNDEIQKLQYPIVKIHNYTDIEHLMRQIRTSHNSVDKSDSYSNYIGQEDKKLLEKIIEMDHLSTIEHINYIFEISNVSRQLLQELQRHRHISLTVISTRYTLRKIVDLNEDKKGLLYEVQINTDIQNLKSILMEYLIFPYTYFISSEESKHNKDFILQHFQRQFVNLIEQVEKLKSNDIQKYFIPEQFKTHFYITVNQRELYHILCLRLSKQQLWEWRRLQVEILSQVSNYHYFLWNSLIKEQLQKGEIQI